MEAQRIIRSLTPKRIAARVGVGVNAVYNVTELFPAHWFPHISALCAEDGIPCAESAFRFERKKRSGSAGR